MSDQRTLPRPQWKSFFDSVSHELTGKASDLEVASLELGDQRIAESVPLIGITYEPNDDVLDISLGALDHLVEHPKEIFVNEGANGIETIAVLAADGVRQILTLREPLRLSAAT